MWVSLCMVRNELATGSRDPQGPETETLREEEDEAMVRQKLDYIHANPVSGKWSLVDDPVDYPHSSLSFYAKGVSTFAPITHVGLALHGAE